MLRCTLFVADRLKLFKVGRYIVAKHALWQLIDGLEAWTCCVVRLRELDCCGRSRHDFSGSRLPLPGRCT